MADIHKIKRRIKSVEGTGQITRAMELVAVSKLGRAKITIEKSRPYYQGLYGALSDIARENTDFSSEFTIVREVRKTCAILIAGDRGLAGGFNIGVFKEHERALGGKDCRYLPIGKKAHEYCRRAGKEVISDMFALVEEADVSGCYEAGRLISSGYLKREFDEVYVSYTNFVSILSQTPATLKLLPIYHERPEKPAAARELIIYEPDSATVFEKIVPSYLGGLLYGVICESAAAELAARRSAMNNASKNAEEIIFSLGLQYNRARQGQITQEITEIIAGAGE